MTLSLTKKRFFEVRHKCRIIVRNHAFKDHPEREFSSQELIRLVKFGHGRFTENESEVAIPDSYLFYPKDSGKEIVIVCSAYREV